MAKFEDPVQEEEVEFTNVEELGQEKQHEPQVAEEPAVEAKPDVDTPDMYHNKSVEDILMIHQEADTLLGNKAL